MQAYSRHNPDKIPTAMAALGALGVLCFLFAPLGGAWSRSSGVSIYIVEGQGWQWGFLPLALAAPFLMYCRLWIWTAIAGSLLFLLALLTAVTINPVDPSRSYRGYDLPGPLHWLALFIGILLILAASVCAWWFQSEQHSNVVSTSGTALRSRVPQAGLPLASRAPWLETVDWGFWAIGVLSLVFWPLGLLLFFAYSRSDDDKGNAALVGAIVGFVLMALRFVAAMAKASG